MRWLVEVMPLGKTEKEALYVDAESWQKALQAARGQRGESAPMSGFSIELLEEGCSAVDPSSRLRYEVRRAPEEGATRVPTARPPPTAGAVPSPRPTSQAPRPMSQPQPASQPVRPSQPPHTSKRPSLSPGALSAIGQASAAVQPATPATAPPPVIPAAPSVPPPPASRAPRADVALNVPSQVIFKREHDPTESVPLTYREYVFLVPLGTTDGAGRALLETQIELVVASLSRVPAGKLVNLAVFDVAFKGKPPVLPLTTLMWKDWRGAPVIEFPRRPGYVRRMSAPPPAAVAPPVAATFQPPPAPPGPQGVGRPASVPPPATIPPVAVAAPPVPQVAPTISVPVAVVAPPPPVPAPVAPAPAVAPPIFAAPLPAIQPVAMPPQTAPAPPPRGRVRGEDLIADLFESMHDLHFLRDAVEGGDFCLSLAMEKIPSQTGIVHLYDIDRREYLVTSARGIAADAMLLRRHTEADVLLSAAMHKQRALVFADATQSEATSLERYAALGGAQSLMVAPVMQSGRFLGAIELLNPLDGQPYTETDGNALTYIAEQFAEFVADRGIVTDPQRIRPRAS